MLVLSRKWGDAVVIGGNIRLTVLAIRGNQVRLGFTAPPDVSMRSWRRRRFRSWRTKLTCTESAHRDTKPGRTPSGRGVARPEGDAGIRGSIPPAPPGRKGGGRQARNRKRTRAAGEVLSAQQAPHRPGTAPGLGPRARGATLRAGIRYPPTACSGSTARCHKRAGASNTSMRLNTVSILRDE